QAVRAGSGSPVAQAATGGSAAPNRSGGFSRRSSAVHPDCVLQLSTNRRPVFASLASCRGWQGMLDEVQQLLSLPVVECQQKLVGRLRSTGFKSPVLSLSPLPLAYHSPPEHTSPQQVVPQADRRYDAGHGHRRGEDAKAHDIKEEKDHHCRQYGEQHVPANEPRLPPRIATSRNQLRLRSTGRDAVVLRSGPARERVTMDAHVLRRFPFHQGRTVAFFLTPIRRHEAPPRTAVVRFHGPPEPLSFCQRSSFVEPPAFA